MCLAGARRALSNVTKLRKGVNKVEKLLILVGVSVNLTVNKNLKK